MLLFVIVAVTVLITRVFLFIKPMGSPSVATVRLHHYMYGVLLGSIGLIVQSVVLYAIVLGLFVDEATYLLMGGKSHDDNYSALSLIGTAILLVAIYATRDALAGTIR
jgi:hypothetical protein